ncbi:peptidogalycan biosysnthesis protein, partial [Aequoribacter sp.]
MELRFIRSIRHIEANAWNACANTDYPFLRHDFLLGLEDTGCTTANAGW